MRVFAADGNTCAATGATTEVPNVVFSLFTVKVHNTGAPAETP
jgi:hypothetical protein